MYKLAVFDLDGTLLNDQHEISNENIEALERLKQNGCKVAIATGRTDLLVKEYAKKIKINGPVIACNGALVRNPFTKEEVFKRIIPQSEVKKIIDICKKDDHMFMAYSKECILSTQNYRAKYYEERNKKLDLDCKVKIIITDDAKYISSNFEINKILIIENNEEKYNELPQKLQGVSGVTICQSSTGFMDIMPKGTSKKNALEMLAKSENISRSEIVAFGDNYNDIEMLEYAGCAITTENGVDSVKEIVDYISIDNNKSGVAYAIKNHLGI
ncbi:Cof-type HAD-IIB family hydrolase [Haloimpatiens sp. FM7330]|uniref:Cof-type HAD-IIB family hydrolase n=1 Tax=Haloimpatiens sp. FM7330 TaxID=3298610 RepID=UPI0036323A97